MTPCAQTTWSSLQTGAGRRRPGPLRPQTRDRYPRVDRGAARGPRQRRGRPLFLIDIAVPRDIAPEARDIDNVFLFDIDNLQEVVEANRGEREQEIKQVELLIEEELRDFLSWFNALTAGPLIKALRQRAPNISVRACNQNDTLVHGSALDLVAGRCSTSVR